MQILRNDIGNLRQNNKIQKQDETQAQKKKKKKSKVKHTKRDAEKEFKDLVEPKETQVRIFMDHNRR